MSERTDRIGTPDEREPIWAWANEFGQSCRACGAGREGTAGATIDHWKNCVGVAAYAQAVHFGVDKETAVKIALRVQYSSGMPPVLAETREAIDAAWNAAGADQYERRWKSLADWIARVTAERDAWRTAIQSVCFADLGNDPNAYAGHVAQHIADLAYGSAEATGAAVRAEWETGSFAAFMAAQRQKWAAEHGARLASAERVCAALRRTIPLRHASGCAADSRGLPCDCGVTPVVEALTAHEAGR